MKRSTWLIVAIAACAVASCTHRPGSTLARGDLAAGAMVSVPGGRFRLATGSGPFNEVATYVSVGRFLLDRTEVTVSAYEKCVRAGRCTPAGARAEWSWIGKADRARWSPACNQGRADRVDDPVNCVDWDQASAYCAFAGKRLPTEEEWEWAARNAEAETAYPWGEERPAGQPCWNGEGSDAGRGKQAGTCAAHGRPEDVNAAGVQGLGGNVSEWTTSETVVGADSRGRGGTRVKVYRGGNWADDDAGRVASWSRSADERSRRDPRLGFRCASNP